MGFFGFIWVIWGLYNLILVLYLFAIANSKLIRRETEGEDAQLGFQP